MSYDRVWQGLASDRANCNLNVPPRDGSRPAWGDTGCSLLLMPRLLRDPGNPGHARCSQHAEFKNADDRHTGAYFDSRLVRQCPPLLSFIPVLVLFMDLQRLHDESPESLTETWFRSLVDSFGLDGHATNGTLAVVQYCLVSYNLPRVS